MTQISHDQSIRVKIVTTSSSNLYLLGQMIELFPGNLYQLGDQMCEGFFTGDDFCVVSVEAIRGLPQVDTDMACRHLSPPSFFALH